MGIESILGAVAGPVLGGLLGGSSGGSQPSGSTTSTTQNQIDPRLAALLYGSDGNSGLLSKLTGLAGSGQGAGAALSGKAGDNYAGQFTPSDLESIRNSGLGLMAGNSAPQSTAAQTQGVQSNAAQIQAPSQNGIDLSGSYNSLINGAPGANPYLTGSIAKGINQANTAIGNWQQGATQNLTENILPGIQSGAQVNGTYGSDRSGIAQGNAIRDFSQQQQQTISQIGQNAQDTAAAQQAAAYDADRNRQLAATQGLSGQQYGAASQNASMQQQTNLANQGAQLATNGQNAGYQQQTNLANQAAQLATNGQNAASAVAGSGLLSGNIANANNLSNNSSQYDLNTILKSLGGLQGFTGSGNSQTSSNPYFTNTAGNVLGGALAGGQIGKSLGGLFGGADPSSFWGFS